MDNLMSMIHDLKTKLSDQEYNQLCDKIVYWTPITRPQQPSRFSNNVEEKRAGVWAQTQRLLYKQGRLSQHKIQMLNDTEGWTWDLESGTDE